MTLECFPVEQTTYRNFNLCPHCAVNGQQALLCRLCEGLPMISRSDGESFHLLLADRPLPYPIEKASGPTKKISICFWYAHVRQPNRTLSCIVIVPGSRTNDPALFRQIELIADLLMEKLAGDGQLDELYEFIGNDSAAVA